MRRDCYIVYSVTRNKYTKEIVEFAFFNAFETEEQAKASLQYEVDLYAAEDTKEVTWIDDCTILYPTGWNENEETIATYENSLSFHDKDEPLIKY